MEPAPTTLSQRLGQNLFVALTLSGLVGALVPAWIGLPPRTPTSGGVQYLTSLGYSAAAVPDLSIHAVLDAMMYVFIFVLLRIILRKDWLAAGVLVIIFASLGSQGDYPVISIPVLILTRAAAAFVLIRFGLLALTVGFILGALTPMFHTTHFTAWYARRSQGVIR